MSKGDTTTVKSGVFRVEDISHRPKHYQGDWKDDDDDVTVDDDTIKSVPVAMTLENLIRYFSEEKAPTKEVQRINNATVSYLKELVSLRVAIKQSNIEEEQMDYSGEETEAMPLDNVKVE